MGSKWCNGAADLVPGVAEIEDEQKDRGTPSQYDHIMKNTTIEYSRLRSNKTRLALSNIFWLAAKNSTFRVEWTLSVELDELNAVTVNDHSDVVPLTLWCPWCPLSRIRCFPVWHRETCFQHLKALTGWKFPIRLHGDEIREHSSAMFSCVYGCNATSEKLRDLEQEAGVKMRLEKHPRPIRKGAVSTPSVVFLLARHFTPQCLIFCKPMHATAFRKWAPSVSLWL